MKLCLKTNRILKQCDEKRLQRLNSFLKTKCRRSIPQLMQDKVILRQIGKLIPINKEEGSNMIGAAING